MGRAVSGGAMSMEEGAAVDGAPNGTALVAVRERERVIRGEESPGMTSRRRAAVRPATR